MPETAKASAGYAALREHAAIVDPRRDVVRASGPDVQTFLQGQLSQDVVALADGASAWSWLLQPAGKVEALVRVTHVVGEEWLLDTDRGWGEHVAARLARFKLRTKVELAVMADWKLVGLRGPAAAAAAPAPGDGVVAVVDASWPGLPGVDLLGPSAEAPSGLPTVGDADWQAARIEAGVPVMGAELTERTIPAETGLIERTVSFTKGCYTGQELVARIDSRGSNVPRLLRGVRLDGPAEPGAALRATSGGAAVPDGGAAGADGAAPHGLPVAGTLTSVAHSPALGWVALGYVRRGVEGGTELAVDGAGAGVITPLPMIGGEAPAR